MATSEAPARRPVLRRVLLYLYSGKNIAGCALGLIGLALHFAGVFDRFWLLIVVGLYLIGALVVPPSRSPDLRMDEPDIRKALERLQRKIKGRVPADVVEKVKGIAETIDSILPRSGRLQAGSEDLFVLQRTATRYLPDTLEAYLALPRAYAAVHPIAGGKTPRQVLSDQLDLLQSRMNEIADAVNKNDSDRLLAQGRFLEERFGRKELSLGAEDGTESRSSSGPTDPPAGAKGSV